MSKPFTPHPYQADIMEWIYFNRRCAVWASMGSGKTVSTLTALDSLSVVEDVFPALVLAPLRVARSTWPEEVAKWPHLAHLRVSVISGTPKQRERALAKEADIYCMNYDNLVWLRKELGDEWPFKTVVADEFTRLKSFRLRQGGSRARALGQVAHSHVTRFIGLTGTPAPNGVKDLWGQVWFLDKGERLGRTFSAFEQRWFRKGYDGYSLVPYDHTQAEVEDKLRDICLTVKGLDVDEPIVNPIYVDLPPMARKVYDAMEAEMFAVLNEEGVEAANAAVRTQKCLQLANGALYIDDNGNWEEAHAAKLDALESIIEEANGAAVLVAYNFKHDLQRLQSRFRQGRVLDADPDTIKQWNAGKIPLLFAHPACLHPRTEVLTEFRGWVRIIDVKPDERVFDGVEFVRHRGCHFSGYKPVIDRLGLTLTADHKILVGGAWVEAKDVRNTESSRREARYAYAGDDPYLGTMLPLRARSGGNEAECRTGQSRGPEALREVCGGHVPPHDGHALLVDMEGHESPRYGPSEPRLLALWRCRAGRVFRVARLQEFLSRYVRRLPGRSDDRPCGQHAGLQQGQLPVDFDLRAAGEQEQQPAGRVSGRADALGGILPPGGREQGCCGAEVGQGYDGRRSDGRLREVALQEGAQVRYSDVYDIVDCGPRNRFLVRADDGDVFISHNSAGHGLNLADGGNIIAFYGVNWSLEEHMQIIERIGPMRQKQAGYDRPVFIYPILARGTVDDLVMERLSSKRSVQDVLLDAMQRRKL